MSNPLRSLPSVHDLLETPVLREALLSYGQDRVAAAARAVIAELRRRLLAGASVDGQVELVVLAQRVVEQLATALQPSLREVINATGVILHTNLGRAPMAEEAANAAQCAARGYLNLELDLETGARSNRQDAVRGWLRQLLGAESGTVVNNNAAATVLTLRALARDREVLVSRGELVEIGGSFRIPEIMAVSGARLREVGTTNITRLSDFAAAITADTVGLLRVHTSNFRVIGHAETPALAERVRLARQHGLLMIDDVGSGALLDFQTWGLSGEPQPRESLAAGADLVLFSGDKLLGGPQSGIIAGRAELISRIERDPLMRAFRVDKMTLAALEATLRIYAARGPALSRLPLVQMVQTPLEVLHERAQSLADALRMLPHVVRAEAKQDVAFMGGGSLPSQSLPTWVVAMKVSGVSESELARRLRTGLPAVMPRVQEGHLLLDLRTVRECELGSLRQACCAAAAAG